MTFTERLYYYRIAQVVSVHDGDSLRAVLDMGFKTYAEKALRLDRIDTPELRSPILELQAKAYAARDYLRARLETAVAEDADIIIHSVKLEKYGRSLAELYINGVNINDELIEKGHAKTYV